MNPLFDPLPKKAKEQLREVDQPDWVEPMLATLTDRRFSDENWIFERKLDGERTLAFRRGDEVRLLSRNQQELNDRYPEVVEALRGQFQDQFIVDGEVVAFAGRVTSFARLKQRMHLADPQEARASNVRVYFYAFDLMYVDGYDTTQVGLSHRKSLLKRALSFDDPVRFVIHRNADGEAYFAEACGKGWEGIIAKQADSPYVHSRSRKWLKFKCVNQQEFVIGGFTEPRGKRIAFGALLLGYYEGERLVYAGKVGTGFDDATLRRLHDRLCALEQDRPPFVQDDGLPKGDVHWVSPQLVAEIGFEEWTAYGKLR